MNEKDVLEIHKRIHDPKATHVEWNHKSWQIEENKDGVRFVVVFGHKFMAQNLKKNNKWTDMAKNGHKITWVITTQPWGRIVDNKIDQWCTLFIKDGMDIDNDSSSKSNSTITLKKTVSDPKHVSPELKKTVSVEKPLCKYGVNCYRRNPSHFEEFAHPHLARKQPVSEHTGVASDAMQVDTASISPNHGKHQHNHNNHGDELKNGELHVNKDKSKHENDNGKHSTTGIEDKDLTPPNKKQKSLPSAVLDQWQISMNELDVGEVIGQGAFGAVKKGKFRGITVAIKVLLQTNNPKTTDMFRAEAELLCRLRHPNIVNCIGIVCPDPNKPLAEWCMVMEYLPLDLKKVIREYGGLTASLSLKKLLSIAKGIALGMNYLHKSNPKIIHRDLKPANVLLDLNHVPRIADFGVSREKEETCTMTRIGTPHYMAPEILQAKSYSEKVDVYSFGMIVWQMVTGKVPFSGWGANKEELNPLQVIMKASIQNLRPEIPPECPALLRDLISSSWHQDPKVRPSFDKILTIFENIESGVSALDKPLEDEPQLDTLPIT